MSSAFLPILRNEFRLFKRQGTIVGVLIFMPLVLIVLLRETLRASLSVRGYAGANGTEQLVPGQAVMFAFFLTGVVALSFFREHSWHTWERLRASRARPLDIIVAKSVPFWLAGVGQLLILFAIGIALFDLEFTGSATGILILCPLYAATLVAFGVMLVAVLKSMPQVNTIANLGAIVFGALGGALIPVADLPQWSQHVAPIFPTYWAMRGFRSIVLESGGLDTLLLPSAMLLAFTAVFVAIAAAKLRMSDQKISWA